MRWSGRPAVALLALLLATADVHAKSPDATTKRLYTTGVRAYAAGRYDDAIKAFEAAYERAPADLLLFDLAQAYRKRFLARRDQETFHRAVELYRRFLATPETGNVRIMASRALDDLMALAPHRDSGAPSASTPPEEATSAPSETLDASEEAAPSPESASPSLAPAPVPSVEARPVPSVSPEATRKVTPSVPATRAPIAYRAYLRNSPDAPNRGEVQGRIQELQAAPASTAPQQIDSAEPSHAAPEGRPAASPPSSHDTSAPASAPATRRAETSASKSAPALTTTASPPGRPVYKKWWFWTATVAAVGAAAVAIGVGVTQGQPRETSFQVHSP